MDRGQGSGRSRRVVVGAALAALVVLAVGVLLGVRSFQSEKRQPNVVYGVELCGATGQRGDCVEAPEASMIYADVLSVEPEDHAMTVRLSVILPAGLFDDRGLAEAVVLNVSGRDVQTFPVASQQIHTVDVTVDFAKLPRDCCDDILDPNTSNRVTSYPFDQYDADWAVGLRSEERGIGEPIPVRVSLKHAVHGFRIEAREEIPEVYVLHIERSGSTIAFAVFVMVMMWGLTLGIVAMAVILTNARRDIGPGVLGFLAAMLFAFPGIRGVLPGAPPLGSLYDYLSFFWCEGIVGITLLVLTALYLTREYRSFRDEKPAASASGRRKS